MASGVGMWYAKARWSGAVALSVAAAAAAALVAAAASRGVVEGDEGFADLE